MASQDDLKLIYETLFILRLNFNYHKIIDIFLFVLRFAFQTIYIFKKDVHKVYLYILHYLFKVNLLAKQAVTLLEYQAFELNF